MNYLTDKYLIMRLLEFELGYEKHQGLNPLLWQGDQLRPEVAKALERIARDFLEFVEVPVTVEDLTITGGQVTYYYTNHSDLDLHIEVDFDRVACETTAAELFDTKRLLYKKKRDIKIHGIPVELYIEDIRTPATSSVYSLSQGWRKKPPKDPQPIDRKEVLRMTKLWATTIDHVMNQNDLEMSRKAVEMLRKYRGLGLKTTGEYGVPNLVYKTLRNSSVIEKLMQQIKQLHDKDLSVK
jgi:hypothetical protein